MKLILIIIITFAMAASCGLSKRFVTRQSTQSSKTWMIDKDSAVSLVNQREEKTRDVDFDQSLSDSSFSRIVYEEILQIDPFNDAVDTTLFCNPPSSIFQLPPDGTVVLTKRKIREKFNRINQRSSISDKQTNDSSSLWSFLKVAENTLRDSTAKATSVVKKVNRTNLLWYAYGVGGILLVVIAWLKRRTIYESILKFFH